MKLNNEERERAAKARQRGTSGVHKLPGISFRTTVEEFDVFRACAARTGMNLTEWLREAARNYAKK